MERTTFPSLARVWFLMISALCCFGHAGNADGKEFQETVQPFLERYCYRCHGSETQKAERRFDRLPADITAEDVAVDYQDILDQLNLSAMPPEDAEQPETSARRKVIAWLTSQLEKYASSRQSTLKQTTLRRLNNREYRNTLRDLLGIDVRMFDPAETFPRDQEVEHLDNVGDTLVMSGHLLVRYLDSANRVVDKVVYPLEQPSRQTWKFEDGFQQQPEIDQVHKKTNFFKHLTLYEVVGADKHEGAYAHIKDFAEGVPYDGFYEIRFDADALHRQHPYDPAFFGTDPSEPLRLGIVAGNREYGRLHKPQPKEPLLAEKDLKDGSHRYTLRVWLDAGFTPRFTFRNGPMDVRSLYARLLRKYPDQFPPPKRKGIVEARFNAIKFGKLPQIHIDNIEIEGPFYEQWPRVGQQTMFGSSWTALAKGQDVPDTELRAALQSFASRAFRRPARHEEISRLWDLLERRRKAGKSTLSAYTDALKAILCSPSFLYLEEPAGERLTSYALANRLAYWLWGAPPDALLLELAAEGKLDSPEVLLQQTRRMLRDDRFEGFLTGFADSWLTLRDLGATPPDRSRFPAFYHYDLDAAMRKETQLFLDHLIQENKSIQNLIDSDFTFVNNRLADLYGLATGVGHEHELVALKDRNRGGLLGQASVLTVTANGIDTSPVVRGVWLLENFLGTPPSPPPPDVEPLDPDIRGAKTIRDQMEKHRSVASCRECHQHIDPLGFALENYDPIGRWRDNYDKRKPIDASGSLPNGGEFASVAQFKDILLRRRSQFALALTSKLMSYGTGRRIQVVDRPELDRIVSELEQRGDGFRDLIELVVTSELFRRK